MPRIFYLTPDMPHHSGGVSVIYDHVITLNKLGLDACVVHFSSSFKKIPWRKFGKDINFLKTRYIDKMFETKQMQQGRMQLEKCLFEFKEDDVFVIPEGFPNILAEFSQKFKLPCKLTVFAQGWLYIVPALQQVFGGNIPSLKQIGASEAMCIGEATEMYMKDMFKFEDEEVTIVPNFIDSGIFNTDLGEEEVDEVYEDEEGDIQTRKVKGPRKKKNKIAFMPRKGMEKWYGIILSLAQLSGVTQGWEMVPIVGMDQSKVAEVLKDCKIFLNFTEGEGFGLPALESLMCGCVHVGNPGLGGLEFLEGNPHSVHNYICDCHDPYQWVKALVEAIKITGSETFTEDGNNISKNLANRYSYENFVKGLKKAYGRS